MSRFIEMLKNYHHENIKTDVSALMSKQNTDIKKKIWEDNPYLKLIAM